MLATRRSSYRPETGLDLLSHPSPSPPLSLLLSSLLPLPFHPPIRRTATRLRLDWTEAGPTPPHSTLVHVHIVTECSTATDTHAAGAQDSSQSALTAGPNPTHKHIIRTETAVCAHKRGSSTRQHDSRHVMLAARTEGAAPNTIRPSTQPFTILCVYCQLQ